VEERAIGGSKMGIPALVSISIKFGIDTPSKMHLSFAILSWVEVLMTMDGFG
jgi:hypothetical protein